MRPVSRIAKFFPLALAVLLSVSPLGCEPNKDWLTREPWFAHPEWYDYLQKARFLPDGTGELVQGDSQAIRYEEKFRYSVRSLDAPESPKELAAWLAGPRKQKLSLHFVGEKGREWAGELELEEGRFEFVSEGPARRKLVFGSRLRFSKCPLGSTQLDPEGLDYFSHRLDSDEE